MDYSWIDIAICVIFLLFALKGLIQGFIKTFFSFTLTAVAIIVSKIFSPKLDTYILEHFALHDTISKGINDRITQILSSTTALDVSQDVTNIPNSLVKFINNMLSESLKTGTTQAAANFADKAADIIVNVFSFLLLFIVIMAVGKIIEAILNKVADAPAIKFTNRLLGLALGLVLGFVVVALVSTAIYYMGFFLNIEGLASAINASKLIKYFYMSFLFG